MVSLFKKVTTSINSEVQILEEFIQKHNLHLSVHDAEFCRLPHMRNEESDPLTTMVYRVTKQEVELLKQELWHICEKVIHEEDRWYMGHIGYAGRRIGFYLGLSYDLEHEWARFWLE